MTEQTGHGTLCPVFVIHFGERNMSLEALKRNGHRLELGSFEQVGEYGIPVIKPEHLEERLNWIRFNHALQEKERICGVHFFLDDYLFFRIWNDPGRYANFLSEFPAVMSPDFSMFTDWPKAVCVYNHWRKHQLAAFWQRMGILVIPTICWMDKYSFDWCFDGEPEGGTVAVSSVGTQKDKQARANFLAGYREMMVRLQPDKIIFFGKSIPDECTGNIELHSPYYDTFTHGLDFSIKGR